MDVFNVYVVGDVGGYVYDYFVFVDDGVVKLVDLIVLW